MTECDRIGRELEVVTVNTSTAGLEEGGREGEERGRGEREGREGENTILAKILFLSSLKISTYYHIILAKVSISI